MLNLKEIKTIKSIAKDFNISQSTVMRILDKLDNYKVDYTFLPEKLCFDEFKSIKNIKGSMSFVYCNAETSEIIDIVEDRRLQSLKEYFSRFPKAKISIDRFHLVQLINRSFNKLRILIMNKQDDRMYNKLKKYWKLLLKNSYDLSSKKEKRGKMFDYKFLSQEDIVKILLSCDKELKLSYDLY